MYNFSFSRVTPPVPPPPPQIWNEEKKRRNFMNDFRIILSYLDIHMSRHM